MTSTPSYSPIALRAVEATAVPHLLQKSAAIALERLARGGGATRWYFVERPEQLTALANRLSPGSSISFYFDHRIAHGPFSSQVTAEILRVAADDGDAVVGQLGPNGLEIEMDFVAGRSDLDSASKLFGPGEHVFYGRFPARDNDSVNAVTIDLPDRDGVTRNHPH